VPDGGPPAGPVEWITITFPGVTLSPAVVPPLVDLVGSGTVRVLDGVVLHKDAQGAVTGTELEDEGVDAFDQLDGDVLELLSDEDLTGIAAGLEPDTTTLVLVWENAWAAAFARAVGRAGGWLEAHDRIPAEDVVRALGGTPREGAPA
jgi:Family of unknown function (DUF6325)